MSQPRKKIGKDEKERVVNIAIPIWILAELDRQADNVGTTRQAIIKLWLSDRAKDEGAVARKAAAS